MRRYLKVLLALALAALWGGGVYFLHAQGHLRTLDRAESAITDFRTVLRGVRVAPDLVTIVEIDDAVVRRLGKYPLARDDLARIIDAIDKLKPKVIGLDILLLDKGPVAGDASLAASLGTAPTVIAAAAVFPDDSQSIPDQKGPFAGLPTAAQFLWPLAEFTERAAVGVVNVTTDQNGVPRSMPMLFRTSDGIATSFPLRVASLAAGVEPAIEPDRVVLGQISIPTDADHALPISFYGPRRTIRTVSANSLLTGELPSSAIEGRVVLVGASVTGGGDLFPTPFDRLMPGVEVIATAITQLMAGDVIRHGRSIEIVEGVICVLLPVMIVGLLAWHRSTPGIIAAAGLVLVWMAMTFFAASSGVWLSAALPLAATVPPVLLFGIVELWWGRQRAHYFAMKSQVLGEFQAPSIQQWLAADPNFLAEPVRQNAAVLFIDLSGFTSLSEAIGAGRVQELLREFHAVIDKDAVKYRGTITGFLGDGAMILFGLPAPAPDDAVRAIGCAVSLAASTSGWLKTLPAPIAAKLGYKLGAHFGVIIASRLGGSSHRHITATGDTVNVASRLMEVAARHRAELSVSDELLRAGGRDPELFNSGYLTGPIETRIRGRSGSLPIWLWRATARSDDTTAIEYPSGPRPPLAPGAT
ncbi:adenylate/guanylate cyclase domain-containing protein [Bradyrhizobium genosp. L]|uniref:CHASE2 domain-containing protein n=1 Tax=Bradyrhizobium genosp. L TaxID=83637 RepID=UPI0018A32101|nr:adenylate/guanylate cyclase domain-containing protein [Bradyrhizobium genosp. L]QPF83297.1 adenylate/guanylate cyclase domain-containing protein [Bradyrhizobium genosp. L]